MNRDSVRLRQKVEPAIPAPAPGFVQVSRSNGSGPPVSLPIVDIREWKSFIRILNEEMRPSHMKSATAIVSFDGAVVLERFWSRYLFRGARFEVAWKNNTVSRPHSWRENRRSENSTQTSETELRNVVTPWETDTEAAEAPTPVSYSPDLEDDWAAPPIASRRFNIHLDQGSFAVTETTTLNVSPLDTVQAVKAQYGAQKGDISDFYHWTFGGTRLEGNKTLSHYGIADGDHIRLEVVLARKPVITFYPLQDNVRITATLTLDPSLSFSYIHPLPAGITISRLSENRSITWDIDADRDGGLKLHPSSEAASYLFWEALSSGRGFDGAAGTDIIIVSVDAFPAFVTGFMKRLGFGVKECQDMVTYWGPQLVGTAVAMRFLEPETYNTLARLDIAAAEEARVVRLFALLCVMDGVHTTADIGEETIEEMVVLLLGGREKPEVGKGFCVFEWGGTIVNSLGDYTS
ncbi:hypothetical protein BDD12DRAFT_852993 [Trichophaea hybrida]|nr:hypothetical protein BDD12DRAFT_852993 [Trichophaea hybrida]